jgi:thymidylate kinase
MIQPIAPVFRALDLAGIRYCVLRDADRLRLPSGGEVDVLVAPPDIARATLILRNAEYLRLQSWGHAAHHFFVRYDADADCWIKLDVVTALAFGGRGPCLVTTLGDACLMQRRHDGICFVPCPEDELLALVLHCVLDKGVFSGRRRTRVQHLAAAVIDTARVDRHLSTCWPGMTWPRLAAHIARGNWAALVNERRLLTRHLLRAAPIAAFARTARDWTLRRCTRLVGLARPPAPSVALIAPDGAGKSTLVAGLQEHFFQPVYPVYMGRRGAAAPARRAPGLGFSRHLIAIWRRYLRARYRQAGGQLVVFDRYTYDALLPIPGAPRRLTRLRRWLLAHACPPPGLVVLLDAPGDVLFARKGEHTAAILERQRQAYRAICARLPRSATVDVTCDAAGVRRQVARLIWSEYQRRAGRRPTGTGRHRDHPVSVQPANLEAS